MVSILQDERTKIVATSIPLLLFLLVISLFAVVAVQISCFERPMVSSWVTPNQPTFVLFEHHMNMNAEKNKHSSTVNLCCSTFSIKSMSAPLLVRNEQVIYRLSAKTMLGMAGNRRTPYYSPYSISYWLRSEAKNLANRKSGRLNKHVTNFTGI